MMQRKPDEAGVRRNLQTESNRRKSGKAERQNGKRGLGYEKNTDCGGYAERFY